MRTLALPLGDSISNLLCPHSSASDRLGDSSAITVELWDLLPKIDLDAPAKLVLVPLVILPAIHATMVVVSIPGYCPPPTAALMGGRVHSAQRAPWAQ